MLWFRLAEKKPALAATGVKSYEPEYWKFGEVGNKHFRHATGQLYAISKDLATYISINQNQTTQTKGVATLCFTNNAHPNPSISITETTIFVKKREEHHGLPKRRRISKIRQGINP
ncbi:hypothetical protein GBA52_013068 [Prunus armeniaca]|nr:hypothetical protein GBA52_013068 [Prunus armeniaca]